jgi:hypothetical protein
MHETHARYDPDRAHVEFQSQPALAKRRRNCHSLYHDRQIGELRFAFWAARGTIKQG